MRTRIRPEPPQSALELAQQLKLLCRHCMKPMGFRMDDHGKWTNIVEGVIFERDRWDGQVVHAACDEASRLLDKVEGRNPVVFGNNAYGDCVEVP